MILRSLNSRSWFAGTGSPVSGEWGFSSLILDVESWNLSLAKNFLICDDMFEH